MLFLEIAKKDLLITLRDKSAWFILLLMPIVLILIFSAVFGGSDTDFSFFPANVGVVNLDVASTPPIAQNHSGANLGNYSNEDNPVEAAQNNRQKDQSNENSGKVSAANLYNPTVQPDLDLGREFMNFLQSEDMHDLLTITTVESEETLQAMIREGQVTTGIVIPANFTGAFFGGEAAKLQVLGDAGSTIVPSVVKSIVDSYITMLEAQRIQFATITGGLGQFNVAPQVRQLMLAELMAKPPTGEMPLTFAETVEEGRKTVSLSSYYAAAMAVMFLLFAGNMGIFSLLEERENRTMLRLKTSTIDKFSLIIGKFLMVIILGLIQLAVLILFTSIFTKADWGDSFVGLAYLSLAGVSATSALSILIGAITKSSRAANAVNWVAIQILAFFGGSYIPLAQLPPFVQSISKFTVNGQALQGYMTLMKGGGLGDVLSVGLILFSSAAVFLALGSYLLKFGEEGI